MAEFEELRINVKTVPEKAGEGAKQLQEFFRSAGDIGHVRNFENLGRQFKLNDDQIKKLAEAINQPTAAMSSFAAAFGRGGFALLAIEASIKLITGAFRVFTDVSDRAIRLQHQATRMGGIHAAQLEANIRAMERNQIGYDQAANMIETYGKKAEDFKDFSTGFRKSLLDASGDTYDIMEKHFSEWMAAPDLQTRMNLTLRYGEEIRKFYEKLGRPEAGAQYQAEWLEHWFGSAEAMHMKENFVNVSEDVKKAWDSQYNVLKEFDRVTTDISQHLDSILRGFVATTLEDLGINIGLQKFNESVLVPIERRQTELSAMTEEERATYFQQVYAYILAMPFLLQRQFWNWFSDKGGQIPQYPEPKWQGGAHHLLENYNDNNSSLLIEEKQLVNNLQLMNSYLALQAAAIGGIPKLPFHNAPMGGAEGESNPIQLPEDASQPGGGAPSEARNMLQRRTSGARLLRDINADPKFQEAVAQETQRRLRAEMYEGTHDPRSARYMMGLRAGGEVGRGYERMQRLLSRRNFGVPESEGGTPGGRSLFGQNRYQYMKEKEEAMEHGKSDEQRLEEMEASRRYHQGGDYFGTGLRRAGRYSIYTGEAENWGGTQISERLAASSFDTSSINAGAAAGTFRRVDPLGPIVDVPASEGPASIRYNNPGAQFPSQVAKEQFGMTGYGLLLGGKYKIAQFPDPEHGAASNMELFSRVFTGKKLGPAGAKWTDSLGFGVPGYDPNMIVTKDIMNDPKFAIPFMKSIAKREAGRDSPLTDEQWEKAHKLFLDQTQDQRDKPTEAGRALLDKSLSDDIKVAGNLNVKVNAPPEVRVKAEGSGLLKDVTLDRSIESYQTAGYM